MAKPDVRSAGRSSRIPYVAGEEAGQRHERRKAENVARVAYVEERCRALGVAVTIHNHGHHWQFRLPSGKLVEWWPSSAKLVVGQRWEKGVHVHDWEQALAIVRLEVQKKESKGR
jgi:hypothetical protein